MIRIINIGQQASTAAAEGRVRGILGPSEEGTRVRVAVQEVDAGKTHRVAPSGQTQVAYVLEGQDARVCTCPAERRASTRCRGAPACISSRERRRWSPPPARR